MIVVLASPGPPTLICVSVNCFIKTHEVSQIYCMQHVTYFTIYSPLFPAHPGVGAFALLIGCQPLGQNVLSAASTLLESAMAPKTPPCMVTMLIAAA